MIWDLTVIPDDAADCANYAAALDAHMTTVPGSGQGENPTTMFIGGTSASCLPRVV